MDALDRILPLAGLLWPVLECDVSISRDPATGDAAFRARVFDVDHPDGLAAKPLAEGTAGTPSDAAGALASHLATLARPRLDVLLRAAGVSPSQRADLADDVARLERAVADLTRDRDRAHRLAVEGATARQQLISDLSIARSERDRLRAELDHQAAHRAAGDAVDLRRYVLRTDVVAALLADALDAELVSRLHTVPAARDALRSCARTTRDLAARFRGDLRSDGVESGAKQGVEGGEGHGESVSPAMDCRKSRVGVSS